MSQKYFILDTNVILHDPQSIFKFGDNTVLIPMTVLEEMDNFKREQNDLGRNAREFSRHVDKLRKKGSLANGVEINESGILKVELNFQDSKMPKDLQIDKADNQILAIAFRTARTYGKEKVKLITKDANLRIKADSLAILADDYEANFLDNDELYAGFSVMEVNDEEIASFYSQKTLALGDDHGLLPNQFVILRDQNNPSHSAIGRFDLRSQSLLPLIRKNDGVWGLHPKNVEQSFALDLLLNDDIQLVSLVGKAGTGKTLLAVAAGLSKTLDENRYKRVLVSRPIFPMGRDLGYLPGDIDEKLNPWMQPIFDNIEFLMGSDARRPGIARGAQELINQGMLNVEPLTYIRGRSIPNQFLIVDEAQNLTPHEMKTILTRAGDNCKVVLTGDCHQIDNPYVDTISNGLSHVVERFKNQEIAGHITLVKGERSLLAEISSNLL